MTVKEMHYDFLIKSDKVASAQIKNFSTAEIDWFLNEAQEVFIKQRLFGNNPKKEGFEESQKRIDDLSSIFIKFPNQMSVSLIEHPDFNSIKVYELALNNLTFSYFTFVKGNVELTANNCINRATIKIIQSDDFEQIVNSTFLLNDELVVGNFGRSSSTNNSSLYIYSLYSITNNKAYVEYIKRPNQINFGGYTYLDGNETILSNCELPTHTHREIVDIAVFIAYSNLQSEQYMLKKDKLLSQE